MKGKFSYNNFFLILLVFAFTGCEKGIDAKVVEVDEEVIHLSSFKKQYKEYMDNNYQSDNLLTRYLFLNKLVDEKLILKYAKENNLDIKWVNGAIENIDEEFDTVLMNPPFGAQRPGADRIFLEKAIEISENIWTIHMAETRNFVEKFVGNHSAKIESRYEFDFVIPRSMPFHTKDVANQKAILYHIASLR